MEDNEQSKVKYQLRYLVMPDYVYEDNNLTDVARRVYCFIHTYNREHFFFSNENLAGMFNCSEVSISRAISLLVDCKYIEVSYRVKADGGKIRFVKDLLSEAYRLINNDKSDLSKVISKTYQKRLDKDNNIKDNNIKVIKENKKKKDRSYPLEEINDSDIEKIANDYSVSIGYVKLQLETLRNYVASSGKIYKDYRGTLRNFILRDMKQNIERRANDKYRGIDARHIK